MQLVHLTFLDIRISQRNACLVCELVLDPLGVFWTYSQPAKCDKMSIVDPLLTSTLGRLFCLERPCGRFWAPVQLVTVTAVKK